MAAKKRTSLDSLLPASDKDTTPTQSTPDNKIGSKKPVIDDSRNQRAIYFPTNIDERLRNYCFREKMPITKAVVEAVNEFLKEKGY